MMPKFDLDSSHLEPVSIMGIPRAYILSDKSLESILLSRNIIGLEYSNKCEEATAAFLRHFEPEIIPLASDIAELVILLKGMYYWTHNAYRHVFGMNLQLNAADTNRIGVEGNTAIIAVRHFNFDAPSRNLIIGDTIASGATICAVLSQYLQYQGIDRLFVFSIAGSVIGGQAIAKFCEEHKIELTIVYSLAAFGLASNGFDLSFLHPDTITDPKYVTLAEKAFKGRPISSAGWDFGSQAQAIRKYRMLCWVEERYWGLENEGVFLETEVPTDVRLISKERAAYEKRFPDISALIQNEAMSK